MSASTSDAILELLFRQPGLRVGEIADRLGKDRADINKALYGPLKGRVVQNSLYQWRPVDTGPKPAQKSVRLYANTNLAKLCRYYLACLGYDDQAGVAVFAANKYGDLDYVELDRLPAGGADLAELDAMRRMLTRLREERERHIVYFGYPTLLQRMHSGRSGWRGFMVEPLLLFPVELDDPNGKPQIDFGFPIVNPRALQDLTRARRETLMEELARLGEELGLDSGNPIELDELVLRLSAIRPEWPWREAADPANLGCDTPFSALDVAGIYNRAVLVMAQKPHFTLGLEGELKQLARLPEEQFAQTALGQWLRNQKVEADRDAGGMEDLIELLPMNLEQRQAVQSALARPLTIITGPPGTGKSQVVTNLLANAAWQKKRVLFASRNNKAVDVVETRINNLGPHPILLRVGGGNYRLRLAELLLSLLSAQVGPNDEADYLEAKEAHSRIREQLSDLDRQADNLIKTRNALDKLEQSLEDLRQQISEPVVQRVRGQDVQALIEHEAKIAAALRACDPSRLTLLARLLWIFTSKERLAKANEVLAAAGDFAQQLDVEAPAERLTPASLPLWLDFMQQARQRLSQFEKIKNYFDELADMQGLPSLPEISAAKAELLSTLAQNSNRLWQLWLRIRPSQITSDDRKLLSQYSALLRMVIEAGADGNLPRQVAETYRSLFDSAAHLLPCWAVTSLSAKGRVPFQPGYYDLVVFDEASQCDIASALPLLYRARAAVVIGDLKQLPHISALRPGQDQNLLVKHGLLSDYPEWAYSYNSLFDLAASQVSGDEITTLLDHHRSHADIIHFSNRLFYGGSLRVATNYDRLNFPARGEPGVRWIDIPGKARRPDAGGAINAAEVKGVLAELRALAVDRGYRGTIGVVSPFRAQTNAIREAVQADRELSAALANADFLADTVHGFQGDERDLMLFSPVVAAGISDSALDFLQSNGNLFNVAITRARAQLVVVGDLTACRECPVHYLSELATYSKEIRAGHRPEPIEDGADLGPDYPKVSNSDQVSDWERMFYRALYKAGIRVIPQYPVEKYTLDFLLIEGKRRLDIEVDGERYHRNWSGELCRRDELRNHRLFELGYDVQRFWVYEVRDDTQGCVAKVKEWRDRQRLPD